VSLTSIPAIILVSADVRTPNDWEIGNVSVQPAVYISVFEMIMNLLMFCALAEGVVITFWRRLLHGTTVSAAFQVMDSQCSLSLIADMHYVYDSSSFWPAVRCVCRLQLNAVASGQYTDSKFR
jgi:hypothetical protein